VAETAKKKKDYRGDRIKERLFLPTQTVRQVLRKEKAAWLFAAADLEKNTKTEER